MPADVAYIGIDPSLTCTGVAALDERGSLIDTFPIQITKDQKKVTESARLFSLRQRLQDYLDGLRYRPLGYAIEGYPFGVRGAGLISRAEWVGVIKYTMFNAGIPGAIMNPMSLKLFASGHGGGDKTGVVAACARYYQVNLLGREDEADALMLACAAFVKMGKGVAALRFSLSPKQLSALDAIKLIPARRDRLLPG